jgi:hypothetical protein
MCHDNMILLQRNYTDKMHNCIHPIRNLILYNIHKNPNYLKILNSLQTDHTSGHGIYSFIAHNS